MCGVGSTPVATSATRPDGISREYDRFKGVTTVTAPLFVADTSSGAPVRAWVRTIYQGTAPTTAAPPLVALVTRFESDSWRFMKCHSMAMLIDGKPAPLPEERHDGNVVDGGVIEVVSVPLPYSVLDGMAHASSIELQICRDEFRVHPGSVPAIDVIRKEVEPAFAPPSPPAAAATPL